MQSPRRLADTIDPPNQQSNNDSTRIIEILVHDQHHHANPTTPPFSINGIEVTPIENLTSPGDKQFVLGREEKEVVSSTKVTVTVEHKSLPSLPSSRWSRMPVKYRILIIVCIQVSMATAAGVALGIFKGHHMHRAAEVYPSSTPSSTQSSTSSSISGTVPLGATPIPTPSNLPPLQRGTFFVPLGMPQMQNASCLAGNNESMAWLCTSPMKMLEISVLPAPVGQENMSYAAVDSLKMESLRYGPQPPKVDPMLLSLVKDLEYPNLGAAYRFGGLYDQSVILQENQIVNQSEGIGPLDSSKPQVQPGALPWVCWFNQTSFEAFIYVKQSSMGANITLNVNMTDASSTRLPVFPFVTKITQRRIPNTPQASCLQMQMLDDGDLVPALDANNLVKYITLNESDPAVQEIGFQSAQTKRDGSPSTGCLCQWMFL